MIIQRDIVEKTRKQIKVLHDSRTLAQLKNFQILKNFTYDYFYKHI